MSTLETDKARKTWMTKKYNNIEALERTGRCDVQGSKNPCLLAKYSNSRIRIKSNSGAKNRIYPLMLTIGMFK